MHHRFIEYEQHLVSETVVKSGFEFHALYFTSLDS